MPLRDSSMWSGHRSIHAGCRSAVADEVHATEREGLTLDWYNLAANRMLENVCDNENNRYLTLNLLTTTIVVSPINASKRQMGFNSAFKGLKRNFVLCKLYFDLFRCSVLVVYLSRIHYLHILSSKSKNFKTQVTCYSKGHTFWPKRAEEFKEMHFWYVEILSKFAKHAKLDVITGRTTK